MKQGAEADGAGQGQPFPSPKGGGPIEAPVPTGWLFRAYGLSIAERRWPH